MCAKAGGPILLPRLLWLLGMLACTTSDQKGAQWTHSNKLEAGRLRAKVGGERFVTHNNSVVTAQVGASVILHCKTSSATGGLVSWIRKRDYQLLTVGLNSHSSDDRFSINYVHWDWQLHIRYVQPRDAGMYECQVSSHPPTSLFVHLQVVEAEAEILGAPEKHVKLGSILRLVCIMHHTTEALSYVFWYRGNEMINYESEEGTGSVVVESDEHTSVLMVTSATRLHSGNYTCAPSNTRPASILVHVLNEYPAAMQHGESSSQSLSASPLLLLLALSLLAQAVLALSGTRARRTMAPGAVMVADPGHYTALTGGDQHEKKEGLRVSEMRGEEAVKETRRKKTDVFCEDGVMCETCVLCDTGVMCQVAVMCEAGVNVGETSVSVGETSVSVGETGMSVRKTGVCDEDAAVGVNNHGLRVGGNGGVMRDESLDAGLVTLTVH